MNRDTLTKEFEEDLSLAWKQISILIELTDSFSQKPTLETINELLPTLVQKLNGNYIIGLFKEEKELRTKFIFGLNQELIETFRLRLDGEIAGVRIEDKSAKMVTDHQILREDPVLSKLGIEIVSLLVIPINIEEDITGLLLVFRAKGLFSNEDLNLGVVIAKKIGLIWAFTKLHQKLSRLERLWFIGMLYNALAHQMRNPLENISLAMESLKADISDINPEVEEDIKDVDEEVDRLSGIIDNFLEFSRPSKEAGVKEEDLNILLNKTIAIIEGTSKFKNIKIVREFEDRLPKLLINIDQMKEVFLNLILNAQEAMPKGGELRITTKVDTNSDLIITFKDTGCGISEERKKEIFRPFYTTKVGGFGIGLAVVERIIKEHNGSIVVDSTLGKGTTFKIKLKGKEVEK